MLKIYDKLEQWRNDRHLSVEKQAENLLGNILEECTEYIRANDMHEKIDAICDISVFTINSMPQGLIEKYRYAEINKSLIKYRTAEKQVTTPNYKELDKSFIGRVVESATMDKYLAILYYCHKTAFTLGYSYVDCMNETIKEISSRVGAWNESIGKFVKDTSDEAKSKWYKADYSACKIDAGGINVVS